MSRPDLKIVRTKVPGSLPCRRRCMPNPELDYRPERMLSLVLLALLLLAIGLCVHWLTHS